MLFFEPWHVSIAEHGDAIGGQANDLLDGVREALGGLIRQSVNQVHIDAVEAKLASGGDEVTGGFERLNAMDGLLDILLEILDAHAEAVEAHLANLFHMGARGNARINLNTNFSVAGKRETLARVGEEILNLFRREVGGSAAAPMELDDLAFARNALRHTVDFFLEHRQVGRSDTLIFANDHIAGAEQAQALAEGKMHIKCHGRALAVGIVDRGFKFPGAKEVGPDRSGRKAGVAWPRTIVAVDEVLGDRKLLVHFVEGRIHDRHGAYLLRA